MSRDRFEFWFRVAEKFGVPVVILVFVGCAGVQSASWVADNVVSPLVNRHVRFIDTTEDTMKEQTRNQAETAKALRQIGESTAAQSETTERLTSLVEEMAKERKSN